MFNHVGLFEVSHERLAEVLAAEPNTAAALGNMGQLCDYQGRFAEAQEYYARSLSSDTGFLYNAMFTPANQIRQGNFEGAEREMERARQSYGDDPIVDSNETLLWAQRGETVRAEAALARAGVNRPSLGHIHHTWHLAAAALASLGRPQDAIEHLQRAAATGFPNYPFFRDDPLASLQGEPAMKHLLADLEGEWQTYREEFCAA